MQVSETHADPRHGQTGARQRYAGYSGMDCLHVLLSLLNANEPAWSVA